MTLFLSSSFQHVERHPLPFKSALSSSYTDASELAQAMQHLEHHLAHIINIRVTSKCLLYLEHDLKLTYALCRSVRGMAGPFGGREHSNAGVDGAPGTRKPGDRRNDGSVAPRAQL